MNVTVFMNDSSVKQFSNVNMVFDNQYMKTYDIHFKGVYENTDLTNKMNAILKEEVAQIKITSDRG
jgi:hypothetical protein